jgi:hypothetical protein
MTELSNAVTVLIARMETHPEDFDLHNGGLYSSTKFGDVAGALYGLAGLDEGKRYAYWFLTDADKEALLEAWKKYHRTAMEKEVMEKIFDDGQAERERIEMRQQMYQAQQRAMIQNQMLQSTGTYQTTTIKPGQLIPMSNSAQNAALQGGNYNGGLLGQAGSALQGLFK